jgi:uncharacterized protein (UPF0212 family)
MKLLKNQDIHDFRVSLGEKKCVHCSSPLRIAFGSSRSSVTGVRILKNIFAKKIGKKLAFFCSN